MIFSILEQTLIAFPLVIGGYFTLSLLKLPDFSIESAYLFGAVFTSFFSFPFPLFLFLAFFGGMFVGLFVTFFNQILKIPFLLSAIIVNGLFHGISLALLKTSVISFSPYLPLQEISLFLCVNLAILSFLFFFLPSEMGFSLAIFGNNPKFFDHYKISKKYVLFVGIMIAHGFAGISGCLFSLSSGFIDLTMNYGTLLLCLTSLLLGKLFFKEPSPRLHIPIIGVLTYFTLQHILLSAGLNLKYFNAFQAALLLTSLLLRKRKQENLFQLDHLGV